MRMDTGYWFSNPFIDRGADKIWLGEHELAVRRPAYPIYLIENRSVR